jgi:ribosome-associated toxin RatA of RatAB toxin-antitoxin module
MALRTSHARQILHVGPARVESLDARENDVEISRSVLVPYSAEAMFDLIEQAERYPLFVPCCTGAEILERSEDWVAARLEITYAKWRFQLHTRNPKRRPQWLHVRLVEGPFKEFRGDWRLLPLADQGCKISFDLSYQPFAGGLFDRVAKAVLDRVVGSVVDAFVKRAEATLTQAGATTAAEPARGPSLDDPFVGRSDT